jgi:hypothetical protein
MVIDLHASDMLEKEKGDRTLQPLFQVFLDFSLAVMISDRDANARFPVHPQAIRQPAGFRKATMTKSHCKRRRMEVDAVAEAEGALESYPPETDRVQRSLVGVAKTAQGCEVIVDEIFPVVLEYKGLIFDSNTGLCRTGIVSVLQKFG